MDVWELVHAERRALIDDLAGVADERWETPSLAQGWSVHDVAAHLVDNARTTPGRLLAGMARARLDLDAQNAAGVATERGTTPAQTLGRLRAVADRRTGPPAWLAPLPSRLVEEIAHGEDIRVPLGITRTYPPAALALALAHQARTPDALGGGRSLAKATTLVATDLDLRLGAGPEVRAPALALLMVLTGRGHAGDALSGPGVDRVTRHAPQSGHAG